MFYHLALTSAIRLSFVTLTDYQAPIQVFGTEGRYATALYSAASKQKQLDQVEKDLKDIHGTLKKKGKLNDLLLNPSLNRNQKRDIIISAMGTTKASKLTGNLLGKLITLEINNVTKWKFQTFK